MASLHFMPGARLRALQFILASPQTWWGRYYYPTYGLNSGLLCLLFGGGVLYPFNCDYNLLGWYCCYREFQWLIQGHMAIKWLSWDLHSAMYCKEIQPVHSEGDQPWDFFGRNDAEAETPVLWPPHAKSWLIGKDSDGGRDWGQEEKGTTEDEMAGWHHRLDGRESEWTPRVGDGQGGLACCDSWGRKESDTTERLIWSDLMY